jgi:IS5 family transposase
MIGRVNPQRNFFDEEIFRRIPLDNILVKINRVVDFDTIAKRLEGYYDRYQGRPAWAIVTMVKVLFLEMYFCISDRELERQLRYNFLYRWFLGLSFYDREPDASSMSVFRSRIGEEGAREVFDEIVRQARLAGVLVERIKAVDATHMEANASRRNVVNFLRHARDKVLGLFRRERPKEAEQLIRDYGGGERTYHKSTSQEVMAEVERTREFIRRIGSICGERVRQWVNLLAETLDKILSGDTNRVSSFVDPDARWGHKTEGHIFFGYKIHTVHDESGIVTSLETFGGNEHEGRRLGEILTEDKGKGIGGIGVTADKLYDSIENRRVVRSFGMTPYILARTHKRKIDKFSYDVESETLSCMEGKSAIGRITQEKGWLYYFSMNDCNGCKSREECLGSLGKRQRVYISEAERERLITGKAVTIKEAKRIRSDVEPKYGEGKVWHGLGRARWRERWRVAIQAFITFSVMNAKRLVRLLEKKEKRLCPS